MEESFIVAKSKKERLEAFSNLLEDTTTALKEKVKGDVDFYSKHSGELLEDVVLENMIMFADKYSFQKSNFKKAEKQHFPDILTGDFFGVEVKSTIKNSWQSIGSSIVESLRQDDIEKVFLMFGKLSPGNVDFRCKPYEDCMFDISVTHSPRYQIDMDIAKGQSIFSKMGVEYDVFRKSPDQIDLVRKYYRNKYKSENLKRMPWWIGDDIESTLLPESLGSNMGMIRLFKDLDLQACNYLKACIFVIFPEVLGRSPKKYEKAALWLCSRHSIINSSFRDSFTASGQISIYVNGKKKWERCPHILGTFIEVVDRIRTLFPELEKDINYYSEYAVGGKDLFKLWVKEANSYLQKIQPKINIDIRFLMNLDLQSVKNGNEYYTLSR